VFTAQYALSLYIKYTRLLFKVLISAIDGGEVSASWLGCYPPGERATRIR